MDDMRTYGFFAMHTIHVTGDILSKNTMQINHKLFSQTSVDQNISKKRKKNAFCTQPLHGRYYTYNYHLLNVQYSVYR